MDVTEQARVVVSTTAGDDREITIEGISRDPDARPLLSYDASLDPAVAVSEIEMGDPGATLPQPKEENGTLLQASPGSTVSTTLTIVNTSPTYTLQFVGSSGSIINSNSNNDFLITNDPASTTIAPGGTTTFTIDYSPSATTTSFSEAEIDFTFVNAEGNADNPFRFLIRGEPIVAEIDLKGASNLPFSVVTRRHLLKMAPTSVQRLSW